MWKQFRLKFYNTYLTDKPKTPTPKSMSSSVLHLLFIRHHHEQCSLDQSDTVVIICSGVVFSSMNGCAGLFPWIPGKCLSLVLRCGSKFQCWENQFISFWETIESGKHIFNSQQQKKTLSCFLQNLSASENRRRFYAGKIYQVMITKEKWRNGVQTRRLYFWQFHSIRYELFHYRFLLCLDCF